MTQKLTILQVLSTFNSSFSNIEFHFFLYSFKEGLLSFLLKSCTPRPSVSTEDQVSPALQLSPADDRPVGSLVWCWKQILVPFYELCITGIFRRKGWACCGVSLIPFMSNLRRSMGLKHLGGCRRSFLHSFSFSIHLKEICYSRRKLSISIPIHLHGSCLEVHNLKSVIFPQGTTK